MLLRNMARIFAPSLHDKWQVKMRKTLAESLTRNEKVVVPEKKEKCIICHDEEVAIKWSKVVNVHDNNALKSERGNYSRRRSGTKPKMIVTHWDVTKSAESCCKVLNRVGLSSHFVIDNDGTIFQMLDTKHKAWHAGKVNKFSIGIDISNAYYLKHQDWYIKNGFGPRPIMSDCYIHGKKLKPFLGFFPIQIQAYKELLKALMNAYSIKNDYPTEDGNLIKTVYKPAVKGDFSGFVAHYHVSKNKKDVAGLDFSRIWSEIEEYY